MSVLHSQTDRIRWFQKHDEQSGIIPFLVQLCITDLFIVLVYQSLVTFWPLMNYKTTVAILLG